MAMPPTSAPAPAPAPAPMAPADDMPPADGAAPADAGMAEGAEPEVILTVCKDPAGGFMLYQGDEPDEGDEGAAPDAGEAPGAEGTSAGQHFDTPQALMQGIMKLLNPDAGAESSFAKGFKGEPDDTAGAPSAPMPG